MAPQDTSTGPERAAARAESTIEREAHKDVHGVGGSEGGHSREGNVNSGGQGPKGKVGDALGSATQGGGLRVGAAGDAYKEGSGITTNPYFQSGTVETAGYGGPPNIGAVTPVFARARRDALIFAGQVVNDTTGNAEGIGKGVGEGLAPELVTMTPLTGQAARDAEKARVQAAASYQSANPVKLHQIDQGVVDAAQPADEYGTPVTDTDGDGVDENDEGSGRQVGPVGGGGSGSGSSTGRTGSDDDYDDRSDRSSGDATVSSRAPQGDQKAQASQPRAKVDPTRQGSATGQQSGQQSS